MILNCRAMLPCLSSCASLRTHSETRAFFCFCLWASSIDIVEHEVYRAVGLHIGRNVSVEPCPWFWGYTVHYMLPESGTNDGDCSKERGKIRKLTTGLFTIICSCTSFCVLRGSEILSVL